MYSGYYQRRRRWWWRRRAWVEMVDDDVSIYIHHPFPPVTTANVQTKTMTHAPIRTTEWNSPNSQIKRTPSTPSEKKTQLRIVCIVYSNDNDYTWQRRSSLFFSTQSKHGTIRIIQVIVEVRGTANIYNNYMFLCNLSVN